MRNTILLTVALLGLTLSAVHAASPRKFDRGDERHLYEVYLTELRARFCHDNFGVPSAAVVDAFGPAMDRRLSDVGDDAKAKLLMSWADEDFSPLSASDCTRVQNAEDALRRYYF